MSPFEHVDELGQLVERVPAQEAADAGDARVVGDLEHPVVAVGVLVEVGDLVLALVGVGGHRAELEDPERAVALAHPHLPEEDRPRRIELDRERDDREARATSTTSATSESDDVHRPLEQQARPGQARRREAEQRHALGAVDRGLGPEHLEQARHDVDLDVEAVQLADDRERLGVRRLREGDDHALDVERADELAAARSPCRAR